MQGIRQFVESPRFVVGALVVVVCVPLFVALGVLHDPRWFPLGDIAITELRVRDVGLADLPLVGQPARLTGHGLQGSHPGPLVYYALAPTWALMGASAWGLMVGVVVLDMVAIGLVLGMVRRRASRSGGTRGSTVAATAVATQGGRAGSGGGWLAPVLGMAAVLAVLLRAYGGHALTEPWNPYMAMLWWVVFLVAVWGVLDDDLGLLPVAVLAGSYCVQAHFSYLGLVPLVGLLAVAGVVRRWWLVRRNPLDRRRLLVWCGAAAGLAVVLWLPPIAEELAHSPGNLSIIYDGFQHPIDEQISLRAAVDVWLARLDPRGLVDGQLHAPGWRTTTSALTLVGLWAATALLTWRRHRRGPLYDDNEDPSIATLVWLHLVVGTALVAGLVSLTRIMGIPWSYLHMWAWGTTALLVFATAWSAASLLVPARTERRHTRAVRLGGAVLGAVIVVSTGAFVDDASYTQVTSPRMDAALRAVAPEATDRLTAPDAPGGGRDGRYVVHWNDPVGIGDQGWGLVDELERVGLDVYVAAPPPDNPDSELHRSLAHSARDHRVLDEGDATGVVTLAIGPAIDTLRAQPDAIELSYHEPRSAYERLRYTELRRQVEVELAARGLDDEVNLDNSLVVVSQHPDLSPSIREAIAEMHALGLPLATFVQDTR